MSGNIQRLCESVHGYIIASILPTTYPHPSQHLIFTVALGGWKTEAKEGYVIF